MDPPAPAERRRRPALTIAATLSLVLALLVGLAVAAVIALTFVSGRTTTLTLIREKADLLVSALEVRLRETLDPAAGQLAFIAEVLAQPEGLADEPARVADVLTGALAAAPQISLVSFNMRNGLAVVAGRGAFGLDIRTIDRSRDRDTMEMVEFASGRVGGFWDTLVFDRDEEAALVARRHSVWRGNQYLGVLNAYVSVRQVSSFLAQVRAGTSGIGFVLYDRDQVLAHPRLTRHLAGLSPAKPLPRLDEVEDPILAAIWSPPVSARMLSIGPDIHVGEAEGERMIYLHRTIYSYGDVPWIIGTHQRSTDLAGELRALVIAALGGLVVLAIAVGAALVIARLLAVPIQRLATAANRLRRFEFGAMADLPASPIRELDDQARAFNAMLAALRWFETYVPRAHVRRLVRRPDGRAPPSVEREVTVLFTDIVGFTSLSQGMKPAATADLLNRHFAMLTHAIETEGGTVDKFIGDSVMAFWGAPTREHRHADRAVRAAFAIAHAIEADNRARRERGQPLIRLRIGIHSGPVVVGNIGGPGRVNYTVVGDTVNVAQRLEDMGHQLLPDRPEVGILVSGATLARLPRETIAVDTGHFTLRGRAEMTAVYRLAPPAAHAAVA